MDSERGNGQKASQHLQMGDDDLVAATAEVRAALGDQVAILAHHYQRDEIVQFADYTGDSLELSRIAATVDAPYIVFCGVYFMAETAAILCAPDQTVIQPVIEALCPMAEMASRRQVASAYDALSGVWDKPIIPITYQNSNADIKAFVGEKGGAVCTSSNARRILNGPLLRADAFCSPPMSIWAPTRPLIWAWRRRSLACGTRCSRLTPRRSEMPASWSGRGSAPSTQALPSRMCAVRGLRTPEPRSLCTPSARALLS